MRLRTPMRTTAAAVAMAAATAAVLAGSAGAAGASARVTRSATEHFQVITTSATAKRLSIVATGAFTGGGVVAGSIRDSANGTGAGTVVLRGGTFKITASANSGSGSGDPSSCLFTSDATGTYRLHGGTGKYAKLSGTGKFSLASVTIDTRNSKGRCTEKPAAYQLIITLHGPVKR
jgi:hypothetical protein